MWLAFTVDCYTLPYRLATLVSVKRDDEKVGCRPRKGWTTLPRLDACERWQIPAEFLFFHVMGRSLWWSGAWPIQSSPLDDTVDTHNPLKSDRNRVSVLNPSILFTMNSNSNSCFHSCFHSWNTLQAPHFLTFFSLLVFSSWTDSGHPHWPSERPGSLQRGPKWFYGDDLVRYCFLNAISGFPSMSYGIFFMSIILTWCYSFVTTYPDPVSLLKNHANLHQAPFPMKDKDCPSTT